MKFYQYSKEQTIDVLKSNSTQGLSLEEVRNRLQGYGLNTGRQLHTFSTLKIFVSQLCEPLILLLAASGAVIFFAGDRFDAFIIAGIIFLNAVIGTFQERRIAGMVKKLRTFRRQESTVVREGKQQVVADELLVPGDILIVQEGNHVPADARIIESYDVLVDEAVLTGESEPVRKTNISLTDDDMTLSEQSNMLFSGSHLISGYVRAVIVATGIHIASRVLVPDIEVFSSHMPLQKDLSRVLSFILWLIVFICISLFGIGLWAGKLFPELLAALIALFMCVVPQGLPVIMTVILVSGAYVMARQKVVAKRLQAIDTLGRAQVVIIDKTGTLTKNELMVTTVVAGATLYTVTGAGYFEQGALFYHGRPFTKDQGGRALRVMMEAALLLDRSVLEYDDQRKKWIIKGSSNEAALRICAGKYGLSLEAIESSYVKLHEIPFSAAHQFHAGFYEHAGRGIIFGIGSPEALRKRCATLNDEQQEQVHTLIEGGMRVLSVAYKTFSLSEVPQEEETKKIFFAQLFEQGLECVGAFGIEDTLKERASEVIASMKRAGLQIVMATGDNLKTACHIAQVAGIAGKNCHALEGTALSKLSDQEMSMHLANTTVYARVLPTDKVRLVQLFQKQGKVVMVIGDGVNDVPALALADVGVAMGSTGSELAREAAHIILLDDAFEKIVGGIEYGRHIFYTFKRVILYFFTTNFAEVLVMLFALAGGYPVPLLACQILWLNLVTDGFLDTALSLEPLEKNLMRPSWFNEQYSLLTKGLMAQVVYIAVLGASLSFGVFAWYVPYGVEKARTMAMVTLTCCQWITALNCRSTELSLFSLSPLSNRWLAGALIGIFVTQIALLYVPVLQEIFKTTPLQSTDWYLVVGVAGVLLAAEELRKYVRRSL